MGAGFSKAINYKYPLLLELSDLIRRNIAPYMFGYYQQICAKVGENIEELLTYLSLDSPWKTEYINALDKALYINIAKNISTDISSLNAMPDKYDQSQVQLLLIS